MLIELIHQIPSNIHIAIGLVFVAGAMIWAFGHRLVRPMMLLAGNIVGASLGFIACGYVSEEIPAVVPVLAGMALFTIIALAAYRFLMSWMLAMCLAVVCPLTFYTYTQITGHYAGQSGEPISVDDLRLPLGEDSDRASDQQFSTEDLRKATDKAREKIDEILHGQGDTTGNESGGGEGDVEGSDQEKPAVTDEESQQILDSWRKTLRRAISDLLSTASDLWQDAPAEQKWGVIATGVGGFLAGILAGVLLPSVSAAIVTAVGGSLVMLVSGFWLATRFGLPIDSIEPTTATASLVWWLSLAFFGLIFQMVSSRRAKKRSTSDSAD